MKKKDSSDDTRTTINQPHMGGPKMAFEDRKDTWLEEAWELRKQNNSGSASSSRVPDVSWEFGLKEDEEKKTHLYGGDR